MTEEFKSGAKRESKDNKPRIDLIPPEALYEWGILMAKGAERMGERNWERGLPLSSFLSSAARHLNAMMRGEVDENHAANLLFNIGGFIATRAWIAQGIRPQELNDLEDRIKQVGDWSELDITSLVPLNTCPYRP